MLHLLQKRLAARKESEFWAHLFFVLSLHIVIVCIALFSYKKNSFLLVNIKDIQASRNTIVRWTGTRKITQKIQDKVVPKQIVAKPKVANKKIESKFGGKFTPVNLGPKIKRKHKRLYQLPVPEKPLEPFDALPSSPKASTDRQDSRPLMVSPSAELRINSGESIAVVEEPLVLSVHEYSDYQMHKEIVDAVCRWWQPPLGAETEKSCVIMVKVSESGACQELIVKESSGIPAYDIAAKSAVLKAQFPKTVWGKECIFQF
jgi:hypothetical protein